MTTLSSTTADVSTVACDALILGVDSNGVPLSHPHLPDHVRTHVAELATSLEASGKVGAITVLPGGATAARRIVLVGVGSGSEGDLRYAAGAASRACGKRPSTVVVALSERDGGELSERAQCAVAEGVVLGSYVFTEYKSADDQHTPANTQWLIAGATEQALARATNVAAAVTGTRDLTNTPPLDLYPASFADKAVELGQRDNCSVTVWDAQQLADQGFGGLIGVGMGSSRPPRLVRIEWRSEKATQTVALVGKGITFDTGGISLKPPKAMETMKSDMSGAAAVMHVVLAAARAQLPITVVGWLCLAENMPSATAQRPSDVLRTYSGTTVEVLNTDAEGRLVLADGLARAVEEGPDVVLDIATLTGAQGLALGTRTSGVMGDDAIRSEVIAAADAIHEDMWPMPLPAHLRESIDSKVADIRNIGDPNGGGMLSAGLFLKEFVATTPWAHLDIARPAFNEGGAYGFTVSGGTGAGVRTLLEFVERRATAN